MPIALEMDLNPFNEQVNGMKTSDIPCDDDVEVECYLLVINGNFEKEC